jgi:TonB family protein
MTRPVPSEQSRSVSSLTYSVVFHLLLLLGLSLTFRRPLVEVPRSISVELSNINNVTVRDVVSGKQSARVSPLKRIFKSPEPVDPAAEVHEQPVATPSLDEHRKQHREELERYLDQMSENQPARERVDESDPLSQKDREAAQSASGSPSGGGALSEAGGPTSAADVNARLVLRGSGRAVVYQPPAPVYPEWARREGIQGKVLVRVWFDKDGFAVDVQVERSSGNPALDSVAKNYALKFRIAPISEDREEEGTVPVTFELVR